tara:strand:- start:353 stop:1129 length:777 start_codon:yes stop_codon:yes gene_type:complete
MKRIFINFFSNYYKTKKFKKIQKTQLRSIKNKRGIEPELLLLDKFIKKGDICFDIGANKGYYTYKFEELTESNNIFTFEPIPSNYKFLKLIFKKCNIFCLALSNQTCISNFKIPIVNNKFLHTRGKLNFNIIEDNETGFESISVKCQTLDYFVKKHKIKKIDFIKIDVEGNEHNVIYGGTKSIKKFKPVLLIEIEQRVHNFNINQIFDYIINLGYDINFYDLKNLKFKSINEFSVSKNQNYNNVKSTSYINNFFCIPK